MTLEAIVDVLGPRAFGPLILLAGVVTLAPLVGDIPGVPTTMGLLVLLTAGQLLVGRECFWLPDWMLRRSVEKRKLDVALARMRPVARFLDRFLRQRLEVFVDGVGLYVVAVLCIAIAALMPAMEFVPFSANAAGVALTVLGLSLTARDGLLVLVVLALTASGFAVLGYYLL